MTQVFTMVVPQWQGAAAGTGPFHGAKAIVRMIGKKAVDAIIDVHEQSVTKRDEGIWYEHEIAENLTHALRKLDEAHPERLFTVGGDCSSDVAAISYLNKRYKGNLTVLWLDAHADLNTPDTSPSHKFHGMPLRLLLGEGSPSLLKILPSTLIPEQVIYSGLRELDHSERQYIVDHAIPNIPTCHECSPMLDKVVGKKEHENLYIHLDVDVMDPEDFDAVACPSPGGFRFEDLIETIEELGTQYQIVGSAVTEYQPKGDDDREKMGTIVKALRAAMGEAE